MASFSDIIIMPRQGKKVQGAANTVTPKKRTRNLCDNITTALFDSGYMQVIEAEKQRSMGESQCMQSMRSGSNSWNMAGSRGQTWMQNQSSDKP